MAGSLLMFFSLLLICNNVFVQDFSPATAKIRGEELFNSGNFIDALPYYRFLAEKFPDNPLYQFRLGVCYIFKSDEAEKGLEILKKCHENKKIKGIPEYGFYLARAYHLTSIFDTAVFLYDSILASIKDTSSEIYRSIRYFREQAYTGLNLKKITMEGSGAISYAVYPLDSTVNDIHDQYMAVITADEQIMYFVLKKRTYSVNEKDYTGEDIAFSKKENDRWGPYSLLSQFNTRDNEAPVFLAPDGSYMVIFRNTQDSSGNLYITRLQGSEWLPLQPLPGYVNSEFWEGSATISQDERMVIFSSERPGGMGGRDLWITLKLLDGNWAPPRNPGPPLNSAYDEDSPFLFYDGLTLYFASNSTKSMGGYDLFYSQRISDSSLSFSYPQNMGYGLNTPYDEKFYVIDASGQRGYLASARKGTRGGVDIFVVSPGHIAGTAVFVLKGKTFLSNKPGMATILIKNLKMEAPSYTYASNAITGKYLTILPLSTLIEATFSANGFVPYSTKIDLLNVTSFKDSTMDVYLYTEGELKKFIMIDGYIRDPETNKPIAGVKVKLRSLDGSVNMETTTDNNGYFVFRYLPKDKEYEIEVDYPYEALITGQASDLYKRYGIPGIKISGEVTDEKGNFQTMWYGPEASAAFIDIKGTVLNPKTKTPIPGAIVQLISSDKKIFRNTISDLNGNFIFRKVPRNKKYFIYVDYPEKTLVEGYALNNEGKGVKGIHIGPQPTDEKGFFSFITDDSGIVRYAAYPPGTLEKYLIPFSAENLGRALKFDDSTLAWFLQSFGDYSAKGLVFKVQVGAFRNPQNFKYYKWEKLDKVEKGIYPDNLTRFILRTPYKTFKQAWARQWEARKYPDYDAFVVIFYKGKRMLISKDILELLIKTTPQPLESKR